MVKMVVQIETSGKFYRLCAPFIILVRCQRIQINKLGYRNASKFPLLGQTKITAGANPSFIEDMPPPRAAAGAMLGGRCVGLVCLAGAHRGLESVLNFVSGLVGPNQDMLGHCSGGLGWLS